MVRMMNSAGGNSPSSRSNLDINCLGVQIGFDFGPAQQIIDVGLLIPAMQTQLGRENLEEASHCATTPTSQVC